MAIFDTFGQTEMSPCTTTLRPEYAEAKQGYVGQAFPLVEFRVVMTSEELIEFCTRHLARYKKPRSVDFIEALPRNPSGKVLKTELRKMYGNPMKY
ncbi:MAG: AMP-binding enzyme [Bacillota bacterium]